MDVSAYFQEDVRNTIGHVFLVKWESILPARLRSRPMRVST